jgi:hypothetical protein
MFASILTGPYCSVHRLLFITSLQEWLPFSPVHIKHAFGDTMQVIEATCPRCLATAKTALHRQFSSLYTEPAVSVTTSVRA